MRLSLTDNLNLVLGKQTKNVSISIDQQQANSQGQNGVTIVVPASVAGTFATHVIYDQLHVPIVATSAVAAVPVLRSVSIGSADIGINVERALFDVAGLPLERTSMPAITLQIVGSQGQTVDIPVTVDDRLLFESADALQRRIREASVAVEAMPPPGRSPPPRATGRAR